MATVAQQPWGQMPETGVQIDLFTLKSAKGLEVRVTNYGGIIVNLFAPDRHGESRDLVEGFDDLAGYTSEQYRQRGYYGSTVGRFANRIKNARFRLDGQEHILATNNGKDNIHGGFDGFNKRVWNAAVRDGRLDLSRTSPDGEEGFPGALQVTVSFSVNDDNELRIEYRATTDRPTIVNLTNHSFFCLGGEGSGLVLGQEIQVFADAYLPGDEGMAPTGEIRPVAGTPFDLNSPRRIGEGLASGDAQIVRGRGYDHNFVIRGTPGTLRPAARAYDPASGRQLEVWTTQPGLQFYTDGAPRRITGKGGRFYPNHSAICLETQHFPDSPNHPHFPSATVTPERPYHEIALYRFSTL